MKKGQSGVSLIALVITIIVVIILAAIAFGTSTRTITNANWSTFTNAVGEVRTALQERVTTVKGEEAAKGTTRTDAQVYNFVAKGASGDEDATAWLPRASANKLSATRIEPGVIENVLGLKNRNKIKVNTKKGSGIEVSYFVTRSGEVFVWPPYEYEGKYWVNDKVSLPAGSDDTATSITFDSGVTVQINKGVAKGGIDINEGDDKINSTAVLDSTRTVYWLDKSSADQPEGLETNGWFVDTASESTLPDEASESDSSAT